MKINIVYKFENITGYITPDGVFVFWLIFFYKHSTPDGVKKNEVQYITKVIV